MTATRREFLAAVPLAASAVGHAKAATRDGLRLWYTEPAAIWTDALPVGNGSLGAMVFGGIETERLPLNEDTLWSGSPADWNNPDAKQYLAEIRRLVIQEEKYKEADGVCKKMQG